MDDRWLIAGLGNPGPEYASTRHNVGFMVADALAGRIGARFRVHKHVADVAIGRLAGCQALVAKPRGYMNLTGGPLAALSGYYKTPVDRIVVLHDDLDLEFGVIRVKRGGGSGGHNGLRSIARSLGDPGFVRVRFGIGRPPGRMEPADYVLRGFSAAQRDQAGALVGCAADAVEAVLRDGVAAAQNAFNGVP